MINYEDDYWADAIWDTTTIRELSSFSLIELENLVRLLKCRVEEIKNENNSK